MRTELRDRDGQVVGTFALAGGKAVLSGASAQTAARIADVNVIVPGLGRTPSRIVVPDDGEAYLRALPDTFRGPYLSATLVEDSGAPRSYPDAISDPVDPPTVSGTDIVIST